MKTIKMKKRVGLSGLGGWLVFCAMSVCAENANSGLWVGQVTLSHVTEVTIPLDENNDSRCE